jgi:hypothetical protein
MTTTSSISLYGASTVGNDFGDTEGFNCDAPWRFVIFLLICMGWNLQYHNLQWGCWFSFPPFVFFAFWMELAIKAVGVGSSIQR